MGKRKAIVPVERIEKAILFIRREKVLLDRDLAELYEDITNCDIPPLTY